MIIEKNKFEIEDNNKLYYGENERVSKDAYKKILLSNKNKNWKRKNFLVLISTERGIEKAELKTFEDAQNLINNCSAYYTQIWEYNDEKECYKFKAEFNDNLL